MSQSSWEPLVFNAAAAPDNDVIWRTAWAGPDAGTAIMWRPMKASKVLVVLILGIVYI
jgi:hypothetical protein